MRYNGQQESSDTPITVIRGSGWPPRITGARPLQARDRRSRTTRHGTGSEKGCAEIEKRTLCNMSNPRLSCKRQSLEGESVLHDDSKLAFYAAGQRQLRRTAGELCDLAGSSETVRIAKFLR